MEINGKITGIDLMPKDKGVTVYYTDNVEEHGENTYKEYNVKVFRQPSDNLKTILRTLVGHAIYCLGLSNGKLNEPEFKSRKIVDMPVFKNFRFSGFKINGDGEEEKLIVKMKLEDINHQEVALTSGKIGIADGTYAFDELLASDMDQVIEEVKNFIKGENYYRQTALEFPKEEKKKSKKSVDHEDDL